MLLLICYYLFFSHLRDPANCSYNCGIYLLEDQGRITKQSSVCFSMSIGRLEHKRFPDNLLKKVRYRRDLRAELQHLRK